MNKIRQLAPGKTKCCTKKEWLSQFSTRLIVIMSLYFEDGGQERYLYGEGREEKEPDPHLPL